MGILYLMKLCVVSLFNGLLALFIHQFNFYFLFSFVTSCLCSDSQARYAAIKKSEETLDLATYSLKFCLKNPQSVA